MEADIDDSWKVLYEFSKGAVFTAFGEVLATLPLSFVKALDASAKIVKIVAMIDKVSTVLDVGKLGFDSVMKVKDLVTREVRALPPEAQVALSLGLSPSAMTEVQQIMFKFGRQDYDLRFQKYDGMIPSLSLWSDTINRVAFGGKSPTKEIRDEHLIKVVELENARAVAKKYRELAEDCEKGLQQLRDRLNQVRMRSR
jgi:hypothetical protein